jgi:hypothetical protein
LEDRGRHGYKRYGKELERDGDHSLEKESTGHK